MADGLLNAFLNILLGKAGREELVRVNEARRAQDLEDREKKIKMMQEASDEVTANMSPARKRLSKTPCRFSATPSSVCSRACPRNRKRP